MQLSSFHSADDRFETLGRAVGVQKEGENIFVVLTRFEYTMHAKSVHMDDYFSVLPLVLSGTFREAYVNNVNGCSSYPVMRNILLSIGGYSVSNCLNAFPLKFCTNGSESLMPWYNMWQYKYAVILGNLPFLQDLSDQAIEAMSQAFATVGVLAGLPPDVTDTLLSCPCSSNADFIQQCNASCPSGHHQSRPRYSHTPPSVRSPMSFQHYNNRSNGYHGNTSYNSGSHNKGFHSNSHQNYSHRQQDHRRFQDNRPSQFDNQSNF